MSVFVESNILAFPCAKLCVCVCECVCAHSAFFVSALSRRNTAPQHARRGCTCLDSAGGLQHNPACVTCVFRSSLFSFFSVRLPACTLASNSLRGDDVSGRGGRTSHALLIFIMIT